MLCCGTRKSYHMSVGSETLLVRGHRDGSKERYGLDPVLTHFRLVVPCLQLGPVGPYQVQGESFPNHLSLEGTSRI
jgi:hypothetical protein